MSESFPKPQSEQQSPRIKSLVIYSPDVPKTLEFYSSLGITFQQEQHGKGPVHYAAELGEKNGILIEIYPGNQPPRIGLEIDSVDKAVEQLTQNGVTPTQSPKDSVYGRFTTLTDPDGRTVELREEPKSSQ